MNFGSDLEADDCDCSGSCDKQDEPLCSPKNENFEEALENFRLKWQKELKITSKQSMVLSKNNSDYAANEEDHESKAKRLFLKGVELAKSGKLYEALQSYRRTEQLVPDIELRLEELKRKLREYSVTDIVATKTNDANIDTDESSDDGDNDDTATTKGDLLQSIQRKSNKSTYFCVPKTMTKELERVKLHFSGCYISKTSYTRLGESSFQDQFLKPWLFIAYYRYLRFFSEGLVLMLTTADKPSVSVGLLKSRYPKGTSILTGYYRLKDDTVTMYFHQREAKQLSYKQGRRREGPYYNSEQTFHLELKIQSHHKRRHAQLVWTRYSAFTKSKVGVENTFELDSIRFPPLWFSRVKSYTSESESPLD